MSVAQRWGFCGACARWRYSDRWFAEDASRSACPVCGDTPSSLEVIENGKGRILLVLELPPGGDLPDLT